MTFLLSTTLNLTPTLTPSSMMSRSPSYLSTKLGRQRAAHTYVQTGLFWMSDLMIAVYPEALLQGRVVWTRSCCGQPHLYPRVSMLVRRWAAPLHAPEWPHTPCLLPCSLSPSWMGLRSCSILLSTVTSTHTVKILSLPPVVGSLSPTGGRKYPLPPSLLMLLLPSPPPPHLLPPRLLPPLTLPRPT